MARVKRSMTEGTRKEKNAANVVKTVKAIWGTLYADDAGNVSQSPGSLVKMLSIILRVAGRVGL